MELLKLNKGAFYYYGHCASPSHLTAQINAGIAVTALPLFYSFFNVSVPVKIHTLASIKQYIYNSIEETHQKCIDYGRWQTYGGIGFGCSISTGISQSFHFTNTVQKSAPRLFKPPNSGTSLFTARRQRLTSFLNFSDEARFWKGAVRYRLYNCWSAAEPYGVYTRDPPPPSPPLLLLNGREARRAVLRSDWTESRKVGREGDRGEHGVSVMSSVVSFNSLGVLSGAQCYNNSAGKKIKIKTTTFILALNTAVPKSVFCRLLRKTSH